jgi:predicted lipid-binding transport protein (Tim44 family)
MAVGVGLVLATFLIWLAPQDDSTKSVAETSTTEVEPSGQPTTTTTAQPGTTTQPSATPASSRTTSEKVTQTKTSPEDRRSDALLGGLLAAGAAFLLAGAFFDRVTGLKAAGVEITLGAKVAEKIAGAVTPTTEEERQKVRAAYVLALEKIPLGTSPGDDPVIEAATASALETMDFE